MSYVVHYDDVDHIVYIIVDGELTMPECLNFSISAYNEGEAHHCKRFIFDLSHTFTKESIANITEFVWNFEKIGVRTFSYIAVIADINSEQHRFFNIMTKNRGYSRIRYFPNMVTAKEWILNHTT